jgi:hypothetical protein
MRKKFKKLVTIIIAALTSISIQQTQANGGAEETSAQSRTTAGQKIGIFYLLWHCPASSSTRYNSSGIIYDNSKILAGTEPWGPIHAFHWWGKPDAGYYCLAEDDNLLRQHAEMLRDAGIDFVFVDGTNSVNQAGAEAFYVKPFDEMMKIWGQIGGAPKIVPWVPITGGGDMVNYFDRMMTEYPDMAFKFKGKPLLLAWDIW